MFARASLGLELPSKRTLPRGIQVYALYREHILCQCTPRSGRLLPPRSLGRAIKALIKQYEDQVAARIKALPDTRRRKAEALKLARAFRRWRKAIHKRYLTSHHLRVDQTERFACWGLPEALRQQLLRQANAEAPPLRLLFLAPVTPYIRLLDKVAVYHRAPGRFATGQWQQVPQERVHAELCGHWVVVLVE